MEPDPKDPFSRANYRSLIAWPERIRREEPFLSWALADIPDRSVADLGCGTGEHARFLAERGYRVAGLDASESMIGDATDRPLPANLRFVLGDLREADTLLAERFGAAICFGNTIPFFRTPEDLGRAFAAMARLLLPGGRLALQILNYQRLRARRERALPINVRPGESPGEEIVFLRLLEWRDGGDVLFFPTTLRLDAESESPVEVVRSRRVVMRGWTSAEIVAALEASGFGRIELFGGMDRSPFDASQSPDLIVAARRSDEPSNATPPRA